MRKSSIKLLVVCCLMVITATTTFVIPATGGQKSKKPDTFDFPETGIERLGATRGDCSLLANPDVLGNPEAHIRELSGSTEWVETRLATTAPQTKAVTRRNYIDEEVFGKMERDKVPSAGLSTDEEFIRRVTLDLTGRIPTADQIRQFVADQSPTKRDRLVDSLIGTPEYVDRWTMWMGDLLKNSARASNVVRYAQGRNAFYYAIKYAIERNMPYDQFVTALIAGSGNNFSADAGYVNYLVGAATPMGPRQDTYDTAAVQASTRFLGIETMDCLLCHNGEGHLNALNVWATNTKREQAWGMASFFSRMQFRPRIESTEPVIRSFDVAELRGGDYELNTDSGNRTPRAPVDGKSVITPQYLFTGERPGPGENYRVAFARMLTKDRQFARATVNYLWAQFFGLGIVDPPTNFDLARLDPKNPPAEPWTLQPSNPELLEKLADEFIASGYNLQTTMRSITKSSAYQLSSKFAGEWKEEYTPYFARKLVRRLDSEEMYDAISRATGVFPTFNIQYYTNSIQWAMQLPDTFEPVPVRGRPYTQDALQARMFLDTFGRGDRDQLPRSNIPSILQSLALMNSPAVTNRIRQSAINGTLASQRADDVKTYVDNIFLTVLGRKPTTAEQDQAVAMFQRDRNQGAQDLMWVLVNKIDFLYNY